MPADDQYLGEVSIVSFNFAPRGWAMCNGQLLPIQQNQALFSILGTTYGGNGVTTFALPDFRGKVPMHWGNNIVLGQTGGAATHTLTTAEMPQHAHLVTPGEVKAKTGTVANQTAPENNYFAENTAETKRFTNVPDTSMGNIAPITTAVIGGSQPHTNMQPYTVLNFIIALQGIFPSRN
ncbi:hypothetical protein OC25_03255 [Pedobacter kyungheensis]|uniref:Phage tail collar domain-containing protein n=1 Tax=Pedobacter kyungheensis TaxID=1069985 RepID=A0A0C1G7Q5_9SPHI|nr:tail fiber protein [Pedobacter kyungheensis]KIA96129.1 hypothetical protein OC25_03255 [Pedobacter kyungheensis]